MSERVRHPTRGATLAGGANAPAFAAADTPSGDSGLPLRPSPNVVVTGAVGASHGGPRTATLDSASSSASAAQSSPAHTSSIPPVMSAYPAAIHMGVQDFAQPDRVPMVSAPDSAAAASFRQLRHRLQTLHDARVIAVSSADPGEGKTTCALNLAMAIAEQGRDSVLLVEANLQHPSLAELLGFAPPVCFARQMMSTLEVANRKWRAVSAFFPRLHVLAIDPETEHSGPLNAAAFSETMLQLKALGHRYIVIDCPAVLGSADINIIQDIADGVLLTVKKGKSKRSRVRKAVSHLEPVTILGTVLMS